MANEEERATSSGVPATRLKIWVLVWGCRGDAVPFAALARTLHEDGHRVVVLGWSNLETLFPGIKFRALDADSATRCEKVRFWMQERAGWPVTGEEEFLLELDVRKFEYITWLEVDNRRKGMSEDALANLLKPKQEALDALRTNEEIDERRWASEQDSQHRHMIERQAKEAGVDLVEYSTKRAAYRAAFTELLNKEAASQGFKARDLLQSLYLSMRQGVVVLTKALADAGKSKQAQQQGVLDALIDLHAWTEGDDVNGWWVRWQERLSGMDLWLEDSIAQLYMSQQVVMRRNMVRYLSEVRPQLVIYPCGLMSIAGAVQAWCKCSILQAWSRVPPLDFQSQLRIFGHLVRLERESQAKLTRLRYYHVAMLGPVGFSARIMNTKQLLSLTSVLFHEDKVVEEVSKDTEWIKKFRSTMFGQWVLPHESVSEHAFFGGVASKEAASAFIAEGSEPPIFVTFGQGRHAHGPKFLATTVVKALMQTNRRGIFVCNWPRLSAEVFEEVFAEDPELTAYRQNVLFLRAVPYDWLLPQCSYAVTHGGLGTLGAVLRAGLPSVCSPGRLPLVTSSRHINALGCGLGLVEEFAHLNFMKLASAMKQVIGNAAMEAKAKAVSETLRGELGVQGAAKLAVLFYKEGTEDEEPKMPWAEGSWDIYNSQREHAQVEVRGNRFWYGGHSDSSGHLRWGTFVTYDAHGLETTCNVQGVFPYNIGPMYGTVESNGEVIKWTSEELWRLRRVVPKSCQCPVF